MGGALKTIWLFISNKIWLKTLLSSHHPLLLCWPLCWCGWLLHLDLRMICSGKFGGPKLSPSGSLLIRLICTELIHNRPNLDESGWCNWSSVSEIRYGQCYEIAPNIIRNFHWDYERQILFVIVYPRDERESRLGASRKLTRPERLSVQRPGSFCLLWEWGINFVTTSNRAEPNPSGGYRGDINHTVTYRACNSSGRPEYLYCNRWLFINASGTWPSLSHFVVLVRNVLK